MKLFSILFSIKTSERILFPWWSVVLDLGFCGFSILSRAGAVVAPPTSTSEQGCDLKLWHVATPGGGWLAFRFYHREEDEEAAAYFAIPDVRLLSCESLWRTWRGNQLIRRRQLLLSIFLPSHQKSLENQYCLPVNNTFCHLKFLIISQSNGFPAWQLWLGVQVQLKSWSVYLLLLLLLLLFTPFSWQDLGFLGDGGLSDARNINSPSALAPNHHPAPGLSCHMQLLLEKYITCAALKSRIIPW